MGVDGVAPGPGSSINGLCPLNMHAARERHDRAESETSEGAESSVTHQHTTPTSYTIPNLYRPHVSGRNNIIVELWNRGTVWGVYRYQIYLSVNRSQKT
jgi:hypothetical protein